MCIIASTPLTASSKTPGWDKSPITVNSSLLAEVGLSRSIWSPLEEDLVVPRTFRPRRSSSSTMWAPTNPVAPVTRTSDLHRGNFSGGSTKEDVQTTHIGFMIVMWALLQCARARWPLSPAKITKRMPRVGINSPPTSSNNKQA